MKTFWEKVSIRLGLYQRRFLNDPLRDVPELAERIRWAMQSVHGNRTLSYQVIAEHLMFAVQYLAEASVEGDLAEFGCMTGRTANVISATMASFRLERNLHLFDSFEGLPAATSKPDSSSVHVQDGTWGPGTCKGISPTALREKCARYIKDDQIKIYEGWFSKNIGKIPSGTKFAMLHVDCDLYQSTIDCLDYLFKNRMIVRGAIILFDDWYCNASSNLHGERKAWAELVERYEISAENLGCYAWGGNKFIVQQYRQK
jgi:Macrocin-O-methyltransferase (TylF)